MSRLADYVVETASNPGTGTVSLAGAPTGRRSFMAALGAGSAYYYITDGVQAEWGSGTVVAGTPNTLSRDTVLGNTAGTTAKLNFTGTVTVYNALPAAVAMQYWPATNTEVQAGTDATKAVTPASLSARTATDARTGLVELATDAEVQAGTDTSRAVTPSGLKVTLDARTVVQRAYVELTTPTTITNTAYVNITAFGVTVTPKSATNKFRISGVVPCQLINTGSASAVTAFIAVYDDTSGALLQEIPIRHRQSTSVAAGGVEWQGAVPFDIEVAAGSTAARTYRIRAQVLGTTDQLNITASSSRKSVIFVEEYAS